jgi:hypothetical protein
MHENLTVHVAGPNTRQYRIVLLAPTIIQERHAHAIPLQRLTARVFDGTNAALFDVKTVTYLRDAARAKLQLVDEAKCRLQAEEWATNTVYEI